MSIEVIPTGASAVVTHDDRSARDLALMAATKDAEADLERSGGLHYGDTVKTIKDAEADLERSGGLHYGDTVKTVKDAEAGLERSSGTRYGNTMGAVKDAEANVREDLRDAEANIRFTVKDSECNIDRLAANRFAETLEEIKDNEVAIERAHGVTRDIVRQSEIATESAKAEVLDTVRKAEFGAERSESQTRSLMAAGYTDLKNTIFNTEKELGYTSLQGFKEQLLESKETQILAREIAQQADRVACANAAANQLAFAIADKDRAVHATAQALAFKEVELRQERMAAQFGREAAVNHCEMKEMIRMDGQSTRDLLKSQETDRLRERAVRAEAQLAAYFARGVSPVAPHV